VIRTRTGYKITEKGYTVCNGSHALCTWYKLIHPNADWQSLYFLGNKMLTLELVTGGAAAVMADFVDHPEVRKLGAVRPQIAIALARSIMEKRCIAYCEALISEKLIPQYEFFKLANGERSDTSVDAQDEWDEAADDMVAAIFEPYERDVSASWLGVAVIDTRIHEEFAISKLVGGFAREVWKALTHDPELTEVEINGRSRQRAKGAMSSTDICSMIGLTARDLTSLVETEMPVQEETEHLHMFQAPTIEQVVEKIWHHCKGKFDDNDYADAFETAADEDDGLAIGGIKRLGGDILDVYALRAEQKQVGPAIGAHMVEKLRAFDPDAATQESYTMSETPSPPPADDPWAVWMPHPDQTSPMTVGPETYLSAPSAPPADQPPPAPAADDPWAWLASTAAPPPTPEAPKKRGRKSAAELAAMAAAIPENRMEPRVLQNLKAATVTDQDIANGLGVSRATANLYALGKSSLVLNNAQKEFLAKLIHEKMQLLEQALQLIK
jgi:hypothetical protein